VRQVALYDPYIRAFRLASDRIGDEGVIGVVTGAGWIDGNATDGMRKCLVEEFDKIYVFNLRGNARTSGEARRKESGNVFGEGSRTPIAVTILVRKKGSSPRNGKVFYCDIGDYFDREEKLKIISLYGSIDGITRQGKWVEVLPNASSDWINQGLDQFERFMPIGDKKRGAISVFRTYSLGVATNRDAWCYNFSKNNLSENIRRTIKTYSYEVKRFNQSNRQVDIKEFVERDSQSISWTRALYNSAKNNKSIDYSESNIRIAMYRPFTKTLLYFSERLNEMQNLQARLFPSGETKNRYIAVNGLGAKGGFTSIMFENTPDLNMLEAGAQCFPLVTYEKTSTAAPSLFSAREADLNITAEVLRTLRDRHSDQSITAEDVFYFVYAFLHLPSYRMHYKNNLSKELPRVSFDLELTIFKQLSVAGRKLGGLHVNYESAKKFPVKIEYKPSLVGGDGSGRMLYRVEKMRFSGTRGREDKSTVIYNEHITISNIPLEAYEYVVNGKPALEWVMERQCVKVDKDSGIVNDANDYANETMNNPAYPLELFQRVITVSLETMKIVRSLPKLDL
jgi:predicted helicase